MQKNYIKTTIAFLLICATYTMKAQHSIIPEPVSYTETTESFTISGNVSIENQFKNDQVTASLKDFESHLTNLGITVDSNNKNQAIIIRKNKSIASKEGYTLKVSNKDIILEGKSFAGIYYGLQTLKQLLPATKQETAITIKGCTIVDGPRFKWRGLMLDVSRHFFTVEEVKAYIDQMAAFKFNTFHWHLTDDNGWRIEIKSLPKLTEVGAWRVERNGKFGEARPAPLAGEATTYGGFYTQAQIKDVVKYATARNVTIIPEIDLPGHSMAALAAYPELSTKKEPKYVSPGNKFAEWFADGSFKMNIENTLNPTDEKVYDFIDKVYGEVAQLFPSKYIHMGGDECYKGYWEESTEVQSFMKKNKIKDAHELQSYFVKRVQKIINSKGKKMIGWDEIIEGGLAKGATVMSWQGMKGGIHAAKEGHEVVMSPTTFAYLDYMQGDITVENKIYASLSLEKTYEFEPIPEGVDEKLILGGQANVWTEEIPTLQFAYYMTYPRALSIAETLWSPKSKKNWNNFSRKTQIHFTRFDNQKINVCKAVLDPIVKVYKEGDKLMCKLTNNMPNTVIHFSTNNTYPVEYATEYIKPFEIPDGDFKLRTQTFQNGVSIGRQLIINRADLIKRK
jgi:hexosaminidase